MPTLFPGPFPWSGGEADRENALGTRLALCYRNQDKLQPDEPLGSNADFTYLPTSLPKILRQLLLPGLETWVICFNLHHIRYTILLL